MTIEELSQLLAQPEGIKLDFKREYQLSPKPPSDTDKQLWGKYIDGQWHELIKDVLALTNGNIGTSGQTGYLIIGAVDNINEDGTRDLVDASNTAITERQLLLKVNSACNPPLHNIFVEDVFVDGKCIKVISIPPSPHVHETTRSLVPAKGNFDKESRLVNVLTSKSYTEHTIFVRNGESIFPASFGVAKALEEDKGFEIAALNDNLKYELTNNLRLLLGRNGGEVWNPSFLSSDFHKYVEMDLYKEKILEAKHLDRLVISMSYGSRCYDKLSIQFLETAISSGKYLKHNFSKGQYERSDFLEGLHKLQSAIASFRSSMSQTKYDDFIAKYSRAGRNGSGGAIVQAYELLSVVVSLYRYEDVVELSTALLLFLSGDTEKLQNVRLSPKSPIKKMEEQFQQEYLADSEILEWAIKRDT